MAGARDLERRVLWPILRKFAELAQERGSRNANNCSTSEPTSLRTALGATRLGRQAGTGVPISITDAAGLGPQCRMPNRFPGAILGRSVWRRQPDRAEQAMAAVEKHLLREADKMITHESRWSQFRRIIKPLFASVIRWQTLARLAVIFVLVLSLNGLNVVNSYVGRGFMTALADREESSVFRVAWFYVGVFLASTLVAVFYQFFLDRLRILAAMAYARIFSPNTSPEKPISICMADGDR